MNASLLLMKGSNLGELEEIILPVVGVLYDA